MEIRKCLICGDEFECSHYETRICPKEHYYQCTICSSEEKITSVKQLKFNQSAPLYIDNNLNTNNLMPFFIIENNKHKCLITFIHKRCKQCVKNFPEHKNSRKMKTVKDCVICLDEFEGENHQKKCSKLHLFKCSCCGNLQELTLKDIKFGNGGYLPLFILENNKERCIVTAIHITCHKCNNIIGRLKYKETCQERYNSDHYIFTEEQRQKQIKAVSSKESKIKRENTMMDKYGVNNGFDLPGVREKAKEKAFSKEAIDKKKKNNLDKYGVEWHTQREDVKERTKNTCMERYGVNSTILLDNTHHQNSSHVSKINKHFQEKLLRIGIETTFEKKVGNKFYDLAIKDTNILIDINPTISHNSTLSYSTITRNHYKEPIDKYYHQNRMKNAIENGYYLFSYFEFMDEDEFINNIYTFFNKYKDKKFLIEDIEFTEPNCHIAQEKYGEVEVYDCGYKIIEF